MKDDGDFDKRISKIDFNNIPMDRTGRQSMAVGRTTNNRLSVPMQFGKKESLLDSAA